MVCEQGRTVGEEVGVKNLETRKGRRGQQKRQNLSKGTSQYDLKYLHHPGNAQESCWRPLRGKNGCSGIADKKKKGLVRKGD